MYYARQQTYFASEVPCHVFVMKTRIEEKSMVLDTKWNPCTLIVLFQSF